MSGGGQQPLYPELHELGHYLLYEAYIDRGLEISSFESVRPITNTNHVSNY
jgi:hypothetical protein